MGLFNKKEDVPDELPDLISDEIESEGGESEKSEEKPKEVVEEKPKEVIEKKPKEVIEKKPKEVVEEKPKEVIEKKEAKVVSSENKVEEVPNKEASKVNDIIEEKKVESNFAGGSDKEEGESDIRKMVSGSDKSFFADLEKEITNELKGEDSMNGVLSENFDSHDVLDKMKSYWEKKKEISSLDICLHKLHDKILKRTSRLKSMEKEWQDVYFDLIEKEEKIKEEEISLKELLREFTDLCKRKKEFVSEEDKNKNNKRDGKLENKDGKEKEGKKIKD